jgi:hypothetical protein
MNKPRKASNSTAGAIHFQLTTIDSTTPSIRLVSTAVLGCVARGDFSAHELQAIAHDRILEKLSGGGMGVLYEIEYTEISRFLALKCLPDELSRDPQALKRFPSEVRVFAQDA